MRRIGNHLHAFFQPYLTDFIEEQRKNNGAREGAQGIQGNGQGIPNHLPEIRIVQKANEMFKANPFASRNPQARAIVLEGDL